MRNKRPDPSFNGPFAPMCVAYIRQKRAIGIQCNGKVWILHRFDDLAKNYEICDYKISKELASAWIEKSPNESDSYHNNRLYLMWQFADFLVQQGYDSYFSRFKLRKSSIHTPYIFTRNEMKRIFAAFDLVTSSPCSPNRHFVVPVLFRMLYGCGLRISEALSLTLQDVDIANKMLHVRKGKNDKERLVPISDSLARRCSNFIDEAHEGHSSNHYFFFRRVGEPYCVSNLEKTFRTLLWDIDIPYCGKNLGPRLHDLRHSFVCHRLNDWVRQDADLMVLLPVLSKYLGHENVTGTQWYLKLTAEAYPDIAEKMNELTGYVFPEAGGDCYEGFY
jgi:integrase